jgi:hypothetical protein
MNKFQLTVLMAALANLALVLLFPPYNSLPLGRAGPGSFDAFYPAFAAPVNGTVNTGLLYLELFPVFANAVVAWLLLQDTRQEPHRPRMRWQSVLQWLVIANLALILVFPPFETQPLAARIGDRAFDGFKFALSGNVQSGIFLPLLYLELLLLALNATSLWLAFGLVARGGAAAEPDSAAAPAPPPEAGAASPPERREQVGRSGRDRRVRADPRYSGPERRRGGERRRGS